MFAENEIEVPEELPVMTLPKVAFFPQALMPLHIFEPRYRQMLRDVLAHDRLFAVAGIDPRLAAKPGQFEPPHRVAGMGIVRACQKNENGTSNLLLQGLCRVRVEEIVSEAPYRRVRICALASRPGAATDINRSLCRSVARLLQTKRRLGGEVAQEFMQFLKTVEDPDIFIDLAAFNLCEDPAVKQRLLETLDVHARLELFIGQLKTEVGDLKLRRKLQGPLGEDEIGNN